MKVVLDTSAAVEIALNGSHAAHLAESLAESTDVLAPELFAAEVVNAIWKTCQFGELSFDAGIRAIEAAMSLVDTMLSHRLIYREAFALNHGRRKAAYDMFYLVLAKREDATLVTLDSALKKEAKRQGVRVA